MNNFPELFFCKFVYLNKGYEINTIPSDPIYNWKYMYISGYIKYLMKMNVLFFFVLFF